MIIEAMGKVKKRHIRCDGIKFLHFLHILYHKMDVISRLVLPCTIDYCVIGRGYDGQLFTITY